MFIAKKELPVKVINKKRRKETMYLNVKRLFDELENNFNVVERELYGELKEKNLPVETGKNSAVLTKTFDKTQDGYFISLLAYGLSKDDIVIEADKNILYVKGEGNWEKEGIKFSNSFSKKYSFDFTIVDVKAELKNGMLYLNVTKSKESEKKKIMIKE